jgi:hypothetical protein
VDGGDAGLCGAGEAALGIVVWESLLGDKQMTFACNCRGKCCVSLQQTNIYNGVRFQADEECYE